MGGRGALALLLGLAGWVACAARPLSVHAAEAGVSYSTWIVSGDTVMLRFVLPAAEANRLAGSAIPVLTVSKLGDYLLEHTAVTASGRDCPAIDQGYDLGRVDPVRVGAELYGFEIVFRCSAPIRSLVLENRALFDRVPGHVDFARIEAGRRFTDQLFTAGRQRVRIPNISDAPAASLGAYVRLGIGHVLRDAGRLCFLTVALLVVMHRPRRILLIIAGLVGGYAVALAADAGGLVVSNRALIEAFIGCLIALYALAAIAPQLARPVIATRGWPLLLLALAIVAAGLRAAGPALLLAGGGLLSAGFLAAIRRPGARTPGAGASAGILLALPAVIFGFLDGFTLQSLLAPLELAFSSRVRMAIGYDLGALLAEAGIFAIAAGAVALASGFMRAGGFGRADGVMRSSGLMRSSDLMRPGDLLAGLAVQTAATRRTLLEVLTAAILAGLGTFWLVTRLHT